MECVGTRGDVDLLVLCVTFLRKLSVRRENVEEMLRGDELDGERKSEVGTSGRRARRRAFPKTKTSLSATTSLAADGSFLDGVPDVLVFGDASSVTERFFPRTRARRHARARVLPRLCVLARNATHANVALALLYHANASASAGADSSPRRAARLGTDLALDALLRVSETDSVAHSVPTVAGLAVNLSADARCAEALAGYENGKPFLAFLAGRLRRKDALGLKIVAPRV